MTAKENRVRQCELNIRTAQSKLLQAQADFQHGAAKAKAEYDQIYEKLKQEQERAAVEVEREKAYLEAAKTAMEQPFEHNED